MSIRRAPRPETYFYVLDKAISEDKRLSWGARGLLIFLLGKPDDWEVSVAHLVKETAGAFKRSGRDAVYGMLTELEKAGYLHREQQRESGSFGTVDYVVSESPHTEKAETAHTDSPDTDQPDTANPTQISNDNNQRKSSNEKKKEGRVAPVFNWETGKIDNLPDDLIAKWIEAYPAVGVPQEIAKAEAWVLANPKNQKKDYIRFLNGWISRAQDRAPRVDATPHRTAPRGLDDGRQRQYQGTDDADLPDFLREGGEA